MGGLNQSCRPRLPGRPLPGRGGGPGALGPPGAGCAAMAEGGGGGPGSGRALTAHLATNPLNLSIQVCGGKQTEWDSLDKGD